MISLGTIVCQKCSGDLVKEGLYARCLKCGIYWIIVYNPDGTVNMKKVEQTPRLGKEGEKSVGKTSTSEGALSFKKAPRENTVSKPSSEGNKKSEKKGYIFFVYVKAENRDKAVKEFWKDIDKKNSDEFDVRTVLSFKDAQMIFKYSKKWKELINLFKSEE